MPAHDPGTPSHDDPSDDSLISRGWAEHSSRIWQRSVAMEAIFNQMTEGLVIFDPNGNLLDMNPAALAIHGFKSVRGIQLHLEALSDIFELFDLSGNPLPTEDWPIGRALRGETFDRYVVRVVRPDTGKTWIGSYGGAPVIDEDGNLILAIVTLRDVTAEKEAEEALSRANKQIATALTATEVGVWHWDVQRNRLVGDRNLRRLFNVDDDGSGVPFEAYVELIHEDDRKRIVDTIERVMHDGGAYAQEYRIVRPGGEVRWILARGRVEIGPTGRPAEFPGVAVDITERKRAEEALRESEERFRVMADGVPFIVWVHNSDGSQEFVNQTFSEFFDVSADEMTGEIWQSLMHADDAAAYLEEFMRCTREQQPFHATVRVRRADGAWRTIESHGRPRFDELGRYKGIVGASVDVTERLEAERSLRELNQTLEAQVRKRTRQVQELASEITMAEQAERRRVSQVLHDDLQQLLYGILMKMSSIRQDAENEAPGLVKHVEQAEKWLADAVGTTKRLTVELSPPVLDGDGLVDSLRWLQTQMKDLHGLDVHIDADHAFYLADDDLQVLLFQIVRELLFNVVKHAGTRQATVALQNVEDHDAIVLKVSDEGKGFSPNKLEHSNKGGVGFRRMRERLQLVGGAMHVYAVPGQGTRVVVRAPVNVGHSD